MKSFLRFIFGVEVIGGCGFGLFNWKLGRGNLARLGIFVEI
jgi:hypothetical protein